MKKLKLYSYSRCSTCVKAIKFLDSKNIDYKLIDITNEAPSAAELKKALSGFDGNIKKLFNTSGQVYRAEGYGEKLKSMSDAEAISDLTKNGKLVKRPVLVFDGKATCGFKEDVWNELLGTN